MQLIFETEHTLDIKSNMTTLEDSLEEKLVNGVTVDVKQEVSDGNKENIQRKDNVILDALGKATNDLIDDINSGNLFQENEPDYEQAGDEKLQSSVQNFVTALINDLESEDYAVKGSCVENEDESHSSDHSTIMAEEGKELSAVSIEIDPKIITEAKKEIDETLTQEQQISTTSENKENVDSALEDNTLISECSKKQSIIERENEESSPIKEEHIMKLENTENETEESISNQIDNNSQNVDDGGTEVISSHKQTNTKLVLSDDESVVMDTVPTKEENKILCVDDDDEVTISDEDKEVSLHNDDDSIPKKDLDTSDNGSGNIQEGGLVDDLTLTADIDINGSEPSEGKNIADIAMDCDEVTEIRSTDSDQNVTVDLGDEDLTTNDVEEVEEITDVKENISPVENTAIQPHKASSLPPEEIINAPQKNDSPKRRLSMISKLSNTLDIFSDEDEEEESKTVDKEIAVTNEKCIDIEDDDDVMVIDDVTNKDSKTETCTDTKSTEEEISPEVELDVKKDHDIETNPAEQTETPIDVSEPSPTVIPEVEFQPEINEKSNMEQQKLIDKSPLLPEKFLQSAKKNLADMTRDDLEEFCILKIVEGVLDRSNLTEIKSKLKTMTQSIEEYRKKAFFLAKQNRDLQVILKSIQEELKKKTDHPITPLKITRSVGMQVLITDAASAKKKNTGAQNPATNVNVARPVKHSYPKAQKTPSVNQTQTIPVPRLVPAGQTNAANKNTPNSNALNNQPKVSSPLNGIKNPPAQKSAEKRTLNRSQSVTVDLTDDEPPAKVATRSSITPPVRLVPSQNLLAPPRQFATSPRKVYIPISGQQSQSLRPGQTVMLKPVPAVSRPRCPPPHVVRGPQNVRPQKFVGARHPAPLPESVIQYQPPNWKSLPPAPELKLSKVENGIVISWKIEGYQDDSFEEIASYQLFAYQETSSPPKTTLWKKIGDVKALPLPMACTLTQFMAGFKYYFAVRAVDIRSRLGPFSLPGSILLLNKM